MRRKGEKQKMASKDLIIDDEYCSSISGYVEREGNNIESLLNFYIASLNEIRQKAILEGDVANALSVYIEYANRLTNRFGILSTNIKIQISNFLKSVDETDKYLF